MSWDMVKLGEICQFYSGTTLPPGDKFEGQKEGFLLLKVSDMNAIGNGYVINSCQKWSSNAGPKSSTCPASNS